MSRAFDENALMERIDGDVGFLKETVAMLDEDSPALLEQIRAAAQLRDAAALVKPAHTLKGMLANFCAPPAEAAARELEMMGREGRLTDLETPANRIQRETERLKEDLHQFLRTKTG
jgi:HPt (histidine-containing phosphotransfer) domain-containing protein